MDMEFFLDDVIAFINNADDDERREITAALYK